MQYMIVIERYGNGYSAYVPDLPGCVAAGNTKAETSKLMREAIELHLEDLKATGQPVPRATATSQLVVVSGTKPRAVSSGTRMTKKSTQLKSEKSRKPIAA